MNTKWWNPAGLIHKVEMLIPVKSKASEVVVVVLVGRGDPTGGDRHSNWEMKQVPALLYAEMAELVRRYRGDTLIKKLYKCPTGLQVRVLLSAQWKNYTQYIIHLAAMRKFRHKWRQLALLRQSRRQTEHYGFGIVWKCFLVSANGTVHIST